MTNETHTTNAAVLGPKVGDVITIEWGNQRCVVRVVRPLGTLDVESLSTGKWYRVSGLPLTNQQD